MNINSLRLWLAKQIAPVIADSDVITGAYRGILNREPDEDGFKINIEHLRGSSIAAILRAFVNSVDYKSLIENAKPDFVNMNFAQPMRVIVDASDAQVELMWKRIGEVWTSFGDTDPLWSVYTDPRMKGAPKDLQQSIIDEFYNSGVVDVEYMDAFLQRAHISVPASAVVAEYGCGVGRTTAFLAKRFASVRGFDISQSHLAMAEKELSARGINNVKFTHVKSRNDLNQLQGFDLFFSVIVLQHNPPPVIMDILSKAFSGLRAGGLAFFQVPSFSSDYHFDAKEYLSVKTQQDDMEMHFVPQLAIYNLAEINGMRLLETRLDHCIGNYRRWMSNTYFMQKR